MALRLHTDDVDAIAQRVVELLDERAQPASPMLPERSPSQDGFGATAEEVAQRYDVKAVWVRANAVALGGRRLGTGPKAPHRFNMQAVDERIAALQPGRPHPPASPRQPQSRRCSRPSNVPLLPIKGRVPPP